MLLPIENRRTLKIIPAAFHVDAVQAVERSVYPEELGIDFLSASAKNLNGPRASVSFMQLLNFDNLIHGGDQESR